MNNEQVAIKTIYLSIAGNTLLAIVKWVTGYFGHSYALIADGIESTSDIFASLLVLFGLQYANRPADENHPYGHGRAEPLITFVVVLFLVGSAVVIAYSSIRNIYTPHQLPSPYTLIVLGAIIAFKETLYRIASRKAKEVNSSSLRADAWHHRSDAITSVAAFIGISVALLLGKNYETADDWAALFASGLILYNSYLIFRPALGEVMDEHLYDPVLQQVREVAQEVEGVLDTEKCLIRKMGLKFYVDLHTIVDAEITVRQGHEIAHKLKDTLKAKIPELADVLIHIEPYIEEVKRAKEQEE
ncbi:cation diffusion facilitator family transporter [Microscilla marina]|uniref:Cation diffusion facilitator family transporter n=1 Tax=Microscilla marina ATCC 23134 TaxID=313606 RepID=A1ZVU2_MICM2|nr:cation diffusion facilitator family transporter [Microscilla marina]EAY25519.1 cation diffusion facilitator family transporter [Microscilla marina ATCC 23134]